jgi:hypothetical protein
MAQLQFSLQTNRSYEIWLCLFAFTNTCIKNGYNLLYLIVVLLKDILLEYA